MYATHLNEKIGAKSPTAHEGVGAQFMALVRKVPMWIVPLLLALLLLTPQLETRVPVDGAYYLSLARNIYDGRGYVDLDWEPLSRGRSLLPWLLAIGFKTIDVSIFTAFVTIRLFFLGNVMVMYFLGAKLFNRWVGLFASLLLLSSVSINIWSSVIHIDHIIPFFMALFLYLAYAALRQGNLLLFVGAGLVIGLGYMGKETALAFLPIPLLAIVLTKQLRNRRNLIGVAALYGIVLLFIAAPILFGDSSNSLETSAVGIGTTIISNRVERFDAIADVGSSKYLTYLRLPLDFYRDNMSLYYILAPIMLLGWLYVACRAAWKREAPFIYLALVFVMLLPFVVLQVITDYRVRQSFVVYMLSYLAVAALTYAVGWWVAGLGRRLTGGKSAAWLGLTLSASLIGGMIYLQAAVEETPEGTFATFIENYNPLHWLSTDRTAPEVVGVTGEKALREAGEWLRDNAEPGAAIAGAPDRLRAVYFYAEGRFPAYALFPNEFEWYLNEDRVFHRYLQNSKLEGMPPVNAETGHYTPLLFWTFDAPTAADFNSTAIQMYIEEFLLRSLREWEIEYIVVSQRSGPLGLYLQSNPSFEQVAAFQEGAVQIFQVHALEPAAFPLYTANRVDILLDLMKARAPEKYAWLMSDMLPELFGWRGGSRQTAEADIENSLPLVINSGLLNLDVWRRQMAATPSESLTMILRSLTEQTVRFPDNRRAYAYLAMSHLAAAEAGYDRPDNQTAAADFLLQTLDLKPGADLLQEIYDQLPRINRLPRGQEVQLAIIDALTNIVAGEDSPARVGINLAALHFNGGDKPSAQRVLQELSQRTDLDYDMLLEIGEWLIRSDDVAGAEVIFDRAISLDPTQPEGYRRLAAIYEERGQDDEIVALYQRAALDNPQASWAALELGRIIVQDINKSKSLQ